MDVREHVSMETVRKSFIAKFLFKKPEEDGEEARNDSDEDSDDSDGSEYSQQAEVNYDCIVRSILAGIVITTAIFMVVFAASNRKIESTSNATTDHNGGTTLPYNVLNDQFLIRDSHSESHVQVLGVIERTSTYVIELNPSGSQHYNTYLIVNFEEETETILLISKAKNDFGSNIVENSVLFCGVTRFPRQVSGKFATVEELRKNSKIKILTNGTRTELESTYIGAPLLLGKFTAKVVNGTCVALSRHELFSWKQVDESLACGDRTIARTDYGTCGIDLCGLYPGVPLSRGLACNKFRSCNYMMAQCDPYLLHKPRIIQTRPYCNCRRTASEDAKKIQCPQIEDDGGECELPRRDLLIVQAELPCSCLYKMNVLYPYVSKSRETGSKKYPDNSDIHDEQYVDWIYRETVISAPALTFDQCPC